MAARVGSIGTQVLTKAVRTSEPMTLRAGVACVSALLLVPSNGGLRLMVVGQASYTCTRADQFYELSSALPFSGQTVRRIYAPLFGLEV